MLRKLTLLSATLAFLMVSFSIRAEQFETFGDYTIHYNALTTDVLQPAVAKAYGIKRSRSRVLLNVSVLKDVLGTASRPVTADVRARAINLNNQLKSISMRKADGGGIYYLGEVTVDHGETLSFIIDVSPEDTGKTHMIKFDQRFFTK